MNLTASDIQLACNILFWVLVGMILIFALIGAIKGFWKTFVGMIIQGLLLCVVAFITPSIANLVGNIDISKYYNQSINLGGTTVQVTSVRLMVCEMITASGFVSPVTGHSVYEAAMALTNVVLSLLVFIVLAILFALFGWLLATLIYHTLVKWFIPRRLRLTHKFRWLGLASGACMGFIASFTMVAPFSYLLHTVKENKDSLESVKDSLGENSKYIDWLVSGSESLIGADWLFGATGPIVNQGTTTKMNDEVGYISFSNVSSLATGLAPYVVNSFSTTENSAFDYTVILGDQAAVNSIVNLLIQNNLIVSILPGLVESAISYVETPADFDLSSLDFSDLSGKSLLEMVKEVYGQLFSAGLVTSLINQENISFSSENKEYYKEAVNSLLENEFVNSNLAYLASQGASYVNKLTGFTLLEDDPTLYDEDNVDWKWSDQIDLLIDCLFNAADILDISLSAEGMSTIGDKIVDGLADSEKFELLKSKVLNGGSEDNQGLLDSIAFNPEYFNISEGIDALFGAYPILKDYLNVDEVKGTFENATHEDIKSEVLVVLDIYPDVMSIYDAGLNEDTQSFSLDFENMSEDDRNAVLTSMKNVLTKAKGFNILKNLLPETLYQSLSVLMKNFLGKTTFFGLSSSSFNFTNADEVIDSLISFVDIVPDILDLMDLFNNSSSSGLDMLESLNVDSLKNILSTIANSSVLNPDKIINGKLVENDNLSTLMKSIMQEFNLESYGLSLPSDWSEIEWTDSDGDGITEIDRLGDVIDDLIANKDLIENGDFSSLDGTTLTNLLTDVVKSDLIGDSVSSFLNQQLKSVWNGLGVSIQFDKEREEWLKADEAHKLNPIQYMGKIFDLIKPLIKDNNVDIQFDSLSSDYLNALLVTIYRSGIMDDDSLADFLGKMIDDSFNARDQVLHYDTSLIFTAHHQDGISFDWLSGTDTVSTVSVYKDDSGSNQTQVKDAFTNTDSGSEIYRIISAYQAILPMIDNISSGSFKSEEIKSLLKAMQPSVTLRRLISPLLNKTMIQLKGQIESMDLDFTAFNFDAFVYSDKFDTELEMLSTLYSYFEDGVIDDILAHPDNLSEDALDSSGAPIGSTRAEILTIILDYINELSFTTTVVDGKEYSFRANFYSVLLSESSVTYKGTVYYIDNLVFAEGKIEGFDTGSLMFSRIKYLESAYGNDAFVNDVSVIVDFLTNKSTYVNEFNIEKILGLNNTYLLKDAGTNIVKIISIVTA